MESTSTEATFHSFQNANWPFTSYPPMITTVITYLLVIFSLREYMKNRKRFELTALVPLHNLFLSTLSLVMLVGASYELLKFLRTSEQPTSDLFCDTDHKLIDHPINYWMYIFYLSKYYELFDTVIIVLKKRPLIFLHVYHHIITMVLVYVMMDTKVPVRWLPMVANCAVHVPMYYYYGISALGMTVWWKKHITVMQITQFVLDLLGNSTFFYFYFKGYKCSSSAEAVLFGQSILVSFLILFMNFFKKTYAEGKSPSTSPSTSPRQAVKAE